MSDFMKIRLRCDGPEAWKFRFEDMETGKLLPVMNFTIDVQDYVMTVNCTLMVSDVEIEGIISVRDMMRQIVEQDKQSETVDEFAERTVSMVLGDG